MKEKEKREIKAGIARIQEILNDSGNINNLDSTNWIQKFNNLKVNLK